MRKSLLLLSALIGGIPMLAAFALAPALADESVTIGGSRAVLIKQSAPRAMPSAARSVPRLVPITVTGRLIAAM